MANIPLKTIKFPGLPDTYTVPQIDDTLTQSGKAADAKATGDEIADLKSDLSYVFTNAAKEALLACFAHVAWTGRDGQDYYNALEAALATEAPPFTVAIINRESIGKASNKYCSANSNITARCRFNTPVKNDSYTIKSADITKYQVNVFNLLNDTLTEFVIDNVSYHGYELSDGTETPTWSDTVQVTGAYFWCSFKKLDGTDFTTDEIENAQGTVYLVDKGV